MRVSHSSVPSTSHVSDRQKFGRAACAVRLAAYDLSQERELVVLVLSNTQTIMHEADIPQTCGLFLVNYELGLLGCPKILFGI